MEEKGQKCKKNKISTLVINLTPLHKNNWYYISSIALEPQAASFLTSTLDFLMLTGTQFTRHVIFDVSIIISVFKVFAS